MSVRVGVKVIGRVMIRVRVRVSDCLLVSVFASIALCQLVFFYNSLRGCEKGWERGDQGQRLRQVEGKWKARERERATGKGK